MGVIAVDPSQIADASFFFAEASTQAARTVTRAFSTLDVVSLSMAGSDAGGMSWATAYDRAVTEVETASAAVVNALGQMSVLLDATGANHANADAASVPGGRDPDYSGTATPVTGYGVCGPPSASGGSTNPPDGWHWIADLMEYTWPNGHQDRLHQAGAAWQAAASSITALTEPLTSEASYLIEEQQSPEIPAISGYITSVTTQTNDLAAAYTSLGSACDTYATHLDTAHSNIISQVDSFVEWTAGLEIVGGLLTIVTVGASDVAANGAVAVKAAAVAAKVGGIIGDLIETIGDVVQTIVNITARIIEITKNLRTLLSLKVAAATTRVVGAMPGIEAFTALANRLLSGKALADYTSGNYKEINGFLRDAVSVDPAEKTALAKRVAAISEALARLPARPGVTFRGTTLSDALLNSYAPGEVVSDAAFTSTTADVAVATKPPFAGNVLMTIIGTTGRDVASLSKYPDEAEVLYDSGANFKVLSKVFDASSGMWKITLQEVP